MRLAPSHRCLVAALALGLAPSASAGLSSFDDISLPAAGYLNSVNGQSTGQFVSGDSRFNNSYSSSVYGGVTYTSWGGWAISNTTDNNLADGTYTNQYSAMAGGGYKSSNYAVGFTDTGLDPLHPQGSIVDLAAGTVPASMEVTNTTYTANVILNGNQFARKFAKGDYLELTINGYSGLDGTGSQVGKEVDVYLADYRELRGAPDILFNTWQYEPLSDLAGSRSLRFNLISTDSDPTYGINTPAYFAMDDFTTAAVPEPASLVLVGLGLMGLVGARSLSSARLARLAGRCDDLGKGDRR